jgi:uncharacterized protein (TIGR03663 family)
VAFLLRMHDLGVRALHHDESLHAVYSYKLFTGQGYIHDPMMHGPFQFHAKALMYFLFGDNDVTARLAEVLLGTGIVALAYTLRAELGRRGAMAAAVMFTVSPCLLYFSRFSREDILFGFHTFLMICGLLGYVRTRQVRWLYAGSVGLALAFSTKESVYLMGFLVVSFAALWIAGELVRYRRSDLLRIVLGVPPLVALNCVLIVVGICVVLFTTFFTNPRGIATGIWGSLDYWLQQQGVNRGDQPVYYYMMLTPVYEYVTLGLALAGVVYRAIRTGRDTIVAAILTVVFALLTAVSGSGGTGALPFAVIALLAATYAMRGRPFQQFVVFWTGAIFLGLSVSGEKMPWLEVHIALPLALLAAITVDDAVAALRGRGAASWLRPVAGAAVLGFAAAALVLASDRFGWALPATAAAVALGIAAVVALAVRRATAPLAGAAAVALFLAFLAPLSVRAAGVAAYEHGDIPVEMLVYTQTTPELVQIKHEVDEYARESGLGLDVPIIVDDGGEGFTWPWAWYLRDYHNVSYPDLATYQNNQSLIASLPPNGIVLAALANSGIPQTNPGVYGPGQRYKHRWWFPEDYRGTTTSKFFGWLRDPSHWKLWGNYFLHRIPPGPLGSTDGVAFFPAGWTPGQGVAGQAQTAPAPTTGPDGRILSGGVGVGPGQFQRPAGLAVDAQGNVWVADSLNGRVQKLGPDGRFQAMLMSPQRFREPWGVAVDRDGNVYVADTWNHRIQKFDRDLKLVATWGQPPQPNETNPGPLDLYGPRSIAIDGDGNLWVTDTGHSRLVKFSPDGKPLGTFGGPGTGPGQFQEPVAVAIAPDGDILVSDAWNGRVQRFDASFGYKGEFQVDGWSQDRGIENKPYLAVAPDGTVYVTVPDTGQVLRFGADGRAMGAATLTADGSGAARPIGVAVDASGNVWVSDGAGNRVIRLPGR